MGETFVDSTCLRRIKVCASVSGMSDFSSGIFQVIMLGAAGVGKTAIIARFVDNYWMDRAIPTIGRRQSLYGHFIFKQDFVGVDFTGRTVNVDGRPVRIQIWDTAGQEVISILWFFSCWVWST